MKWFTQWRARRQLIAAEERLAGREAEAKALATAGRISRTVAEDMGRLKHRIARLKKVLEDLPPSRRS